MAKVSEPVGPLATAQSLAHLGLQVLPARYQDKAPIVKWEQYQNIRTENMLPTWFGGGGKRNYWVMTGRISGVIVIDCDSDEGDAWWRKQLGEEVMDSAAQVKTAKGTHYWFKLPEDWPDDREVESWTVHPRKGDDFKESWDVRADGTGVIAPPSVHETGHVYAWLKPLAEAAVAPNELLDGTVRARAPHSDTRGGVIGLGGATRSMLTSLLSKPPGGDGSGRNDWLARVAGHYAKTYHTAEDLYRAHCLAANNMMGTPLDDKEFEKTIRSVWKGEHTRNKERALDATCGWLQSAKTRIMTQVVRKGPGDEKVFDLDEYADFDLVAKGVMVADDDKRVYWVTIRRKRPGTSDVEEIDAVLPGATLGDDRGIRRWLAAYACTVIQPDNIWPKTGSVGVRLQRYLESQRPAIVKVTRTLGWDAEIVGGAGGFVTHDGIVTAEEVFTCEAVGVKPDPQLKAGKTAPHEYGFDADPGEAIRVLDEVMSFHDEETTAVFGAWWAACLIKPQIEQQTSLFPFMAIEAASESGKTNGFFAQMVELNGNTSGEQVPTKAALRDMAAAHRNGIVWVDDMDDPAFLMELLRAATSGGALTKMGEDRESVKTTPIVSPIVISGEALGLGTQKALLDRAIILKAESPVARRSRHDAGRAQWDDVLALRNQYPNGLSSVAGWLVQSALALSEPALAAVKANRKGSGRVADKLAILRAGARLLDALLAQDEATGRQAWDGGGWVAEAVEKWAQKVEGEQVSTADNALTLELLPWALRTFKYPTRPVAGERPQDIDTPAFVRENHVNQQTLDEEPAIEIWFNTALLAQAWEKDKNGRVERRTGTAAALKDQADALKAPAKRVKISNSGGRLAYYRRIDGELAQQVVWRAQGK